MDPHNQSGRSGFLRYARPALVAGAIIAVVSVALLIIIFALDSFNATVYSVSGNDVRDATEEARGIRDAYSAARAGGIAALLAGAALAAAGALTLFRHRGDAGESDDEAAGEEVDFEDLAGR